MARVCQLTGKKRITGNNVSHSHIRTKRKFNPNIQEKRIYIPEEDRWIKLKISTSVLRTMNKKGVSAVIKEARKQGYKI